MSQDRKALLTTWCQQVCNMTHLTPLAQDASFRSYYRAYHPDGSFIAMDAPPELEPCKPFIQLSEHFEAHGVCVPRVLAADETQGFLLLSDFGDQTYFSTVNEQNADHYYRLALDELLKIHQTPAYQTTFQSCLDREFMRFECASFQSWCLEKWLGRSLDEKSKAQLATLFDRLIDDVLAQPTVFMHRDYHSRNLMVLPDDRVGVLDFQNAMRGPVTYDVVSLLRDCYVRFSPARVREWALYYKHRAIEVGIIPDVCDETFMQWFDVTGLQRHVKALFTFSRKFCRDHNDAYLKDVPRTITYIKDVLKRYECYQYLGEWLT